MASRSVPPHIREIQSEHCALLTSAYAAWVAVCLVWGTTYLGIRIALETIPPALVGGIRYVIAGAVLAALLCARGERLPPRAQWPGLALLGFLMICLGNGGVIWAEQWVPSGIAAVVVASSPFWMSAVEALSPHGERFTSRTLLGLVIGFAGIVALVWPDLTAGGELGRQFAVGVAALQVACIGWSLGSAYSKRHGRDQNALTAAALQMLFGGLMMLAIASARGEWLDLSFTARSLAAEIYLIVFGSLVGYTAYVYALKHLPVSTVSMYAYVNPVIAVALGSLVLGEPIGPRVVIASAMVLAGIAVVGGLAGHSSFSTRDSWLMIHKSNHKSQITNHKSRMMSGPPYVCLTSRSMDLASNDSTPADQPHQEQHHGDDQQDPDEVPERVAADHPQ